MKNYLKIIKINEFSITPKYLQIYNSILRGIEDNLVEKGDILPSINDLSSALDISRNTIEKSYKELKKIGIVSAVPGKGYFISNINFDQPNKILLMFNKLSSHKKLIYDAFSETLGNSAAIDFYIYNNNFNFFKRILSDNLDKYTNLVIVPHFIEKDEPAEELLNELPKDKLILMDKLVKGVTGDFSAIYEDFEKDIYSALEQLMDKLVKYHTIKIIFPENSYFSDDILTGFTNFCTRYAFNYVIVGDFKEEKLVKGTVYINLMEDDLIELIERTIDEKLIVGKDIGVISYNETPIKNIILNGITTISTDFRLMGRKTAEIILANSKEHLAIPFKVTLRNSL